MKTYNSNTYNKKTGSKSTCKVLKHNGISLIVICYISKCKDTKKNNIK